MKTIWNLVLVSWLAFEFNGAAQNLLLNGSFEQPSIFESYRPLPSGSTQMPGWTVGATGNVEIIRTHWPASDGQNSLDLNGTESGSVSQPVYLTNGFGYMLEFDMAYNTAIFLPMTLKVSVGGYTQTFTNNPSAGGPFWQRKRFAFTATNTGPSTLSFEDTSNTQLAGGAALDNVFLMQTSSALQIRMYPGIQIDGLAGRTYRIDTIDALSGTNAWVELTSVVLPNSSFLFIDTNAPSASTRYYRAVLLP